MSICLSGDLIAELDALVALRRRSGDLVYRGTLVDLAVAQHFAEGELAQARCRAIPAERPSPECRKVRLSVNSSTVERVREAMASESTFGEDWSVGEAVAVALTLYLEDFGMPLLIAMYSLLDVAATSTGNGRSWLSRRGGSHIGTVDAALL